MAVIPWELVRLHQNNFKNKTIILNRGFPLVDRTMWNVWLSLSGSIYLEQTKSHQTCPHSSAFTYINGLHSVVWSQLSIPFEFLKEKNVLVSILVLGTTFSYHHHREIDSYTLLQTYLNVIWGKRGAQVFYYQSQRPKILHEPPHIYLE